MSSNLTVPATRLNNNMSPRELKKLKSGAMLKLFYKANADAVSEMICDTLHLNIAIYFSEAVKTGTINGSITQFTTSHGSKDTLKALFQWTAACCTGGGLVPFMPVATLWQLMTYIELAKQLGVPLLIKQLDERVRASIKAQLPVGDLDDIFTYLPAKHPYRQLAVEVVSCAIEQKKVRDWAGLHKLQETNQAYRDDIQAFRDMIHAPQREAQKEAWLKKKAERDAEWQAKRKAVYEARHEQNEKEKAERLAREHEERKQQHQEEREERRRKAQNRAAIDAQNINGGGGWLKSIPAPPTPTVPAHGPPRPLLSNPRLWDNAPSISHRPKPAPSAPTRSKTNASNPLLSNGANPGQLNRAPSTLAGLDSATSKTNRSGPDATTNKTPEKSTTSNSPDATSESTGSSTSTAVAVAVARPKAFVTLDLTKSVVERSVVEVFEEGTKTTKTVMIVEHSKKVDVKDKEVEAKGKKGDSKKPDSKKAADGDADNQKKDDDHPPVVARKTKERRF